MPNKSQHFQIISKTSFHTNLNLNPAFTASIFEIAVSKDTPDSDNDATCAELKADEGFKSSMNCSNSTGSRPVSISSEPEKKWVDVVTGKVLILWT